MAYNIKSIFRIAGFFCFFLMHGCDSHSGREVFSFVEEIKKQNKLNISLHDNHFSIDKKSVQYHGKDFDPFDCEKASEFKYDDPKHDSKRQLLEAFPLDTLTLVGVFQSGEKRWGIISDHNKKLHVILVGSYVGKNRGMVVNIGLDQVEVVEELIDQGGIRMRNIKLYLAAGDKRT